MNGTELLNQFRGTRSEVAFSELVRRYTNLVYSIARRRLNNSSLAEDVAQDVFVRLANAVPQVRNDAELLGWLHQTTVHAAIDLWRSDTRRRNREQRAVAMEPALSEKSLWDEVSPVLDEMLSRLSEADRQTLLLRFFDERTMRDVGQTLGVSEDAAKMRVSRALDRLRSLLSARGITCTAAALAAILAEHSIDAAPGPVAARLGALKVPTSAGAFGVLTVLRQASPQYLAAGVAVVLFLGLACLQMIRSFTSTSQVPPISTNDTTVQQTRSGRLRALTPDTAQSHAVSELENVKIRLFLVDAATDGGLANAKIHVAFFGPGGQGEGHELVTGGDGLANIQRPDDLEKDRGMNVFAVAEGYVPKVVNFHGTGHLEDYTLRLDSALTVGGSIVDEQGNPVPGVKIRMQIPDDSQEGSNTQHSREHIDFQLNSALSDADGKWLFPYVPKGLSEIRFILTHDDYAVTLPGVPTGKGDLMKLILTIDRGFEVSGRVIDTEGTPIGSARIKELTSLGYRRQSTTADAEGSFVMRGLRSYESYHGSPTEIGVNGVIKARGWVGVGDPNITLVVEAPGYAPQIHKIMLRATNDVNFTLAKGRTFHGRILDEEGNPIINAVARTDTDSEGLRPFEWLTHTDEEGRFEWNSAPSDPILFWFEATGYEVQRDRLMTADGSDHEIRLKRK